MARRGRSKVVYTVRQNPPFEEIVIDRARSMTYAATSIADLYRAGSRVPVAEFWITNHQQRQLAKGKSINITENMLI